MSDKKTHRSKGVVERNLPRWFRKAGFKAWEDFCAFFAAGAATSDPALAQEWKDFDEKGDDAPPKALGHLLKLYNKARKFSKTEVAPPWFFVEGSRRENLPADDAWSIELAMDLDHERSQKPAAPRPPKGKKPEGQPGAPAAAPAAAASTAPEAAPVEPPATGVVPPPASDGKWQDALKRLPGTIQLLVDGRGKNASELNERRRKALDLAQWDRAHQLHRLGGELRKELLTWLTEKKRSTEELEAEVKRRLGEVEDWLKAQMDAARAKVAGLDEHAREELRTRLRKAFPKIPDENALVRMAKQALEASRPLRRGAWAKKIIDDFNNSRGSAAEKIRDPRIVDGLVLWLTQKRDEDTPTDGEIYDQIQRMGGPNLAARKRRDQGPKPPKPKDQRDPRLIEAEREAQEDERAAQKAARQPKKPAAAPAPAAEAPAAPAPADAPAPAPTEEPPAAPAAT